MKNELELGDRVRDRITGFKGLVICESLWMYGCRRLTVQPEEIKDGKVVDSYTFDEGQLELIKKKVIVPLREREEPGGPQPEPKRHETPIR